MGVRQNFFIFMQFLGKVGQIVCWCPLGLAPTDVGEVYIEFSSYKYV